MVVVVNGRRIAVTGRRGYEEEEEEEEVSKCYVAFLRSGLGRLD